MIIEIFRHGSRTTIQNIPYKEGEKKDGGYLTPTGMK